jgi:REP element-mobilizing transposase RayT
VFLDILGKNVLSSEVCCYAWALMPNHYHALVRPADTEIGAVMRRINGAYARYFNK